MPPPIFLSLREQILRFSNIHKDVVSIALHINELLKDISLEWTVRTKPSSFENFFSFLDLSFFFISFILVGLFQKKKSFVRLWWCTPLQNISILLWGMDITLPYAILAAFHPGMTGFVLSWRFKSSCQILKWTDNDVRILKRTDNDVSQALNTQLC